MMRIGRAAAAWTDIAVTDSEWQQAVDALRAHAAAGDRRIDLSIYPWDIVTEMETRLASPQAMLLVVPNGKIKLLNALRSRRRICGRTPSRPHGYPIAAHGAARK